MDAELRREIIRSSARLVRGAKAIHLARGETQAGGPPVGVYAR